MLFLLILDVERGAAFDLGLKRMESHGSQQDNQRIYGEDEVRKTKQTWLKGEKRISSLKNENSGAGVQLSVMVPAWQAQESGFNFQLGGAWFKNEYSADVAGDAHM